MSDLSDMSILIFLAEYCTAAFVISDYGPEECIFKQQRQAESAFVASGIWSLQNLKTWRFLECIESQVFSVFET